MLCSRIIAKKHLIKLNGNVRILCKRYESTEVTTTNTNNAVVTPVKYPEILDLSPEETKKREDFAWYEAVKKCGTIEEKLIKVNMPKYYGWQMMMMTDKMIPYNALPYVQQYTRTQFERGLPSDWCKRSTEELDAIVNDNIGQLEEAIAFEYQGYK